MTAPVRGLGRSLGTVGVALLVATGLGTLLQIVCARLLTPAEFTVFSGFWGVVFGFGAAVAPIEQEISRLSAHAALDGKPTGGQAVRTAAVGGAAVLAASLVTLVPAVGDRLFSGDRWLGVVALAGGLGFVVQVALRGLLIGHDRIRPYGAIVVAEALARVLVGAALVVAGLTGVVPFAVAVACGSFVWLLFAAPAGRLVDRRADGEPWPVVVRRVLVLMLGAALTASVLTGYPAMVNLLVGQGDDPALGALFATVVVARFPLLLLSPVQTMAVPVVVRLSCDEEGRRRLRALLLKGSAVALAVAVAGAVVGWLVGPWAVRLVYGPDYVVEPAAVAGLAWSSVLLGATLLLAAVLVARAQADRVLLVWTVVAGTSAFVLLLWPGAAVDRAVLGLVLAPTVGAAVALALVVYRSADPQPVAD